MDRTRAEDGHGAGGSPGTGRRGTEARREALEIILRSDGGRRCFIDELLEEVFRRGEFQTRDRHLLQEIAYGTIRHRNTLDHLLNRHVRFAMKRQRPEVRWALRLGAYQVVYLSRIPPHAAVDRSIDAFKQYSGRSKKEAGFLNAVLRKLAGSIQRKTREDPLEPHDPSVIPIRTGYCHFDGPVLPLHTIEPVGHISLKHSHPRWMVERWRSRFGEEEAVALCRANNRTPRVIARITSLAPSREEVLESLEAQNVAAEPLEKGDASAGRGSLVLGGIEDPGKIECLRQGWIQIQDPTASAIGRALSPPAGARVLDLCAAPGGKAMEILEAIGPGGSLVACDVQKEKIQRLEDNLERAEQTEGQTEVREISPEPDQIDLVEEFTHILLDVPCSNTGVLARRPEARWRVKREDLATLAKLQKRLLAAAIRHLAPSGRLVYATCSLEPEENEEVIAWALAENPQLKKAEDRCFLPHRDDGDGGYYAVLEGGGSE